jgi:hypothetical protein
MSKWILIAIAAVLVVTGGAVLASRAFAPEPKQIGCRGSRWRTRSGAES